MDTPTPKTLRDWAGTEPVLPSDEYIVIERTRLLAAADAVEELESMLAKVLDAHYGLAFHHIGDGDGIKPEMAKKLAKWWKARTQR